MDDATSVSNLLNIAAQLESSLAALVHHCPLASRLHPGYAARAGQVIRSRRTPQPTSSERRRAHKTRAAHLRCSRPSLPLALLSNLKDRGANMTFSILPWESKAHIISSIINLVCPQCGGRMWEYQCEGRCRRNWLPEWEWANRVTRSSKSRQRR